MVTRLLWPAATLVLTLAAFVVVVLAVQASASSLSPDNAAVPLPPPTVPGTVPAASPTSHGTSMPTATHHPVSSPTPTRPGPQPTSPPTVPPCALPFTDVQPTDWFYEPVQWMFCNGVVEGYPDNTFRPNNPTTRAQIAKIAIGAFGLPVHTEGGPHFTDVPVDNVFYSFVETAYFYSIVTGYPCGGPGEPCDDLNRPYFRPDNQVTRGQLAKITTLAAIEANPSVWQLLNPAVPTFTDVAFGSTFYTYI